MTESIQGRLQRIFADVQNAIRVGPEELHVIGGAFEGEHLPTFIDLWARLLGEQMPWRIYEYVSKLSVEQSNTGIPTADLHSLERARCFGATGDLDVRRDLSTVYWRFVGDPAAEVPDVVSAGFATANYWAGREDVRLRRFEKKTLQWRPDDDRVGGEWLTYGDSVLEDEKKTLKVFLKQYHYVWAGRLEFVRFIDFETEIR